MSETPELRLFWRRHDPLSFGLVIGIGALTAWLYPRLPAELPVHFDVRGAPDRWATRAFAAWLLPASALVMLVLPRLGLLVSSPGARERLARSPLGELGLLTTGLLAAAQVLVLYTSIRPGAVFGDAIVVCVGVFLVVYAQLLPRVRRNLWFGVRTPSTLVSDEVWLRTQRFGGLTCTAGGLIAVSTGLAGAGELGQWVITIAVLAPLVHSIIVARHVARGE